MEQNQMRIALVVPERKIIRYENTCVPFGLAYVASYLKKVVPSCEVSIIDGSIGQNVDEELYNFQPNIVGVSALTSQVQEAYSIGDMLRLWRPNVLTVIGGVHASALPFEALEHYDCVVVGEGEIVFADIVKSFIDGHRCSGIMYGKKVEDLNSLPVIDYNSLNIKEYIKCGADSPILSNPCMILVTSRGCPYQCVFCRNSGNPTKPRYVNAEQITQEILWLHQKFGVCNFYFGDDEFLINTKRLKELSVLFRKHRIMDWIRWGCQARSQTCTIETLRLAKSAGCVLVSIGLESGCKRILNYLKCGTTTLADNERALNNCAEVGLFGGGNFIYGVFDQTLEEMRESFRWVIKQKHIFFASSCVLVPYPATEVWRRCQELRLLPNDVDYSRLILTQFVDKTYVLNRVVPKKVFAKFMVHTSRLARIHAKRNQFKSFWKFVDVMCKRPVFYWAWLFHPILMMKITFRRT